MTSKACVSNLLLGSYLGLLMVVGSSLPAQTTEGDTAETEALPRPYPDAPAVTVLPRDRTPSMFPCQQCHGNLETNPEVRAVSIHRLEFDHGNGRIWCLQCHDSGDRDYLATLLGRRVTFDQAYLVCGGCHGRVERDWYFGAHGKRVDNWQGERTIYGCSHCHDPHSPSIKPRAPLPPPPLRRGLER